MSVGAFDLDAVLNAAHDFEPVAESRKRLPCVVAGCSNWRRTGHATVCKMHRERKHSYGDVYAEPRPIGRNVKVDEATRADIVRRMRNFEKPTAIARMYGISRHTVLGVMHALSTTE